MQVGVQAMGGLSRTEVWRKDGFALSAYAGICACSCTWTLEFLVLGLGRRLELCRSLALTDGRPWGLLASTIM